MAKLTDFKQDKRNANKGTAKGQKMIVRSIQEDGFGRSVLADKNGNLIAGNKTIEASAEVFGVDVEPIVVETDGTRPVVVKRTDLDLGDPLGPARRLAYRDNLAGYFSFELDAAQVMADIEAGFDFEAIDVGLPDLGEMLDKEAAAMLAGGDNAGADTEPQVDRAEELRQQWCVESGQLWQLGEHRIICGDCTDPAVVARVMGGERAALVFTDPPYGVAIGDKNKFLNSFQNAGRNLKNITNDVIGKDELFDMLVKAFTLTREVMEDCAAIYVTAPQGGELGLMMMMMMMMMADLPVRHVLNWVKNAPTFSMGRLDYDYQHEPILYTWKKSHKHYGLGAHKSSVWKIDKPRSSKEHPTMKPVELVENAILNSSPKDAILYEPFSGSGTTIIACENLGRRCRAIEIDAGYVAVALQRFLDHTGKRPELIQD